MQKDVRAGCRYICKQACVLFARKIKHRTTCRHAKYKILLSAGGQKVITKENAKKQTFKKEIILKKEIIKK